MQDNTIAFLRKELQSIDGGTPPAVVETHISVVFLGATLAWKLKKAVKLPYLDFTSVERRLALCERELAMNRRSAPSLYRSVHRVVRRNDGKLAIDADGTLVDAVLEMKRFDEDGLLDRMAVRGDLTPLIVTRLASVVANFHSHAEPSLPGARSGSQRVAEILQVNQSAFIVTRQIFPGSRIDHLIEASRHACERRVRLLDARQREGRVRLCHGDLHLRNIVLLEGIPTLFDCLEFDVDMATIDILYDLSFVLMDLWHRGLRPLANLLLNRYLDEIHFLEGSDETPGLPLLGLFMSMRAAVRAHVQAARALEMTDLDPARATVAGEAGAYLDLATMLLAPHPTRMVAIGGLSGSGKSTAAAAIAAEVGSAPGARVLSSDRVRKAMHGVTPLTRLGPEAYFPEVSARVYATLQERAAATLSAGHSVIVDAVFDRAEDRARIEAVAKAAAVPFTGIWLEAPQAVRLERVAGRQGDPSDAGVDVVRRQSEQGAVDVAWTRLPAHSAHDWTALLRLLE